jgi:predicted small secreted protein
MKKILTCTFVLLTCVLLTSCKDEHSSIGEDILGNLVDTEFTDTITLQAYSVLEDTINTTNTSANILGHISDPVFGKSSAGIFTQLALSGSAVNFGSNPVIDSVILTLQLSGYYGDTNSNVGFRVHQLNEALDSETKYYQNSTVNYDPTPLNYSLTGYSIRPNSSIVVDTNVLGAHLRIRLSDQFGQYLLNHQDDLNNRLKDFLKGLYIDAVSHTGNEGYMLITNMTSALSGMTLYYHNDENQPQRYTLSCSENSVRFTHFDHAYSTSVNPDFIQEVLQGQTTLGEKVLFVQGGGGVKTRITFPYLENTFAQYDNKVVIHRAELVITNADPNERFFIQPSILTLQGIRKSDNAIRFLPDDDYYTNANYFGGTYDASKKEYRFRITKYVQQLILQQDDWSNTINLIVRGSAVRPHRLVFEGTNPASPSRLRLEITYSKY